jgi:hypothetical protein
MAAVETQVTVHHLEVAFDAIAFRPRDPGRGCSFDRHAGVEIADGNADAAETAAEPAVGIEESEMQSRRNAGRDFYRIPKSSFVQTSAPEVFSLRGFFETEYQSRLRYPGSVGNRS